MDRWCLYRPGDPTLWNVHLDIAPWEYATSSPSLRATAAGLSYGRVADFRAENNTVTADDGRAVQGSIRVGRCRHDLLTAVSSTLRLTSLFRSELENVSKALTGPLVLAPPQG